MGTNSQLQEVYNFDTGTEGYDYQRQVDRLTRQLYFEPRIELVITEAAGQNQGPIDWFKAGPEGARYALFGDHRGIRDMFPISLMDILNRFE